MQTHNHYASSTVSRHFGAETKNSEAICSNHAAWPEISLVPGPELKPGNKAGLKYVLCCTHRGGEGGTEKLQ